MMVQWRKKAVFMLIEPNLTYTIKYIKIIEVYRNMRKLKSNF